MILGFSPASLGVEQAEGAHLNDCPKGVGKLRLPRIVAKAGGEDRRESS